MKRVLIVNDEMVAGGVSRVLVNMLKSLKLGIDVQIDILILHPHGEVLGDIPDGFRVLPSTSFFDVCDISLSNAFKMGPVVTARKVVLFFLMKTGLIMPILAREHKKIVKEEYDVEIAYKEGFCTLFVAAGGAKKKINWVHVDYSKFNYSRNHMGLVKKALKKIDINATPSKEAADSYKTVFELEKDLVVCKNFIDEGEIVSKSLVPCALKTDSFNIVTVGRLHYQKAITRMMDVCRRLRDDGLDFHYWVVGDGEERSIIEKMIANYNLSDKVTLVGYDPNPYRYMRAADLFLLPSLYEGAPTVIYEALAIKETPIMSCEVAGIYDQLENGRLGLICENSEEALYENLKMVLEDTSSLDKYRNAMLDYNNKNNEESNRLFKELIEL